MQDDSSSQSSSNESNAKRQKLQKHFQKRSKKYDQKYSSAWEQNSNFKKWISPSQKGQYYFYCKVCKKDYSTKGGKNDVEKHYTSNLHIKNARQINFQKPINEELQESTRLEQKVKEASIKIAAYVVEHNLSFSSVDHLTALIKNIGQDKQVVDKLACNRSKCEAIIKNVIGKYNFEQTINFIKNNKFSLIVDESTDVSSTKHLALVVRFFDGQKIVIDQFLTLLPVSDATANNLYKVITDFLNAHEIPWKTNLIGFAADGASNMFAENRSVAALLQKDIKNLFLMKCSCHSFAKCSSYACEKLPRYVEDLARDIYNYLSHSYKRQTEFKEFQIFLDLKPHKILRLSQTRWLSLLSVVKRLLEQYDAFILYFTNASFTDRLTTPDTILMRLKEPITKLYLQFLEFVLPFFNDINIEMQSEEPKIYQFYDKITGVLKALYDCFINPQYLKSTDLKDINFRNPRNYLSLEQMYLGATISVSLNNTSVDLDATQIKDFQKRCLEFYIEACQQIIKRFKLNDENSNIIKKLSVLDPVQVLNGQTCSIVELVLHFPNLVKQEDLNAIDNEWRQLRNFTFSFEPPKSAEKFWVMIKNLKCGDDTKKFPLLSNFALNLLCLPHSSATVERIFSEINLNKNKIRNKLETPALVGILRSKAHLKCVNENCYNMNIKKGMIKKHNQSMYENT